jgi:hypothetical protein
MQGGFCSLTGCRLDGVEASSTFGRRRTSARHWRTIPFRDFVAAYGVTVRQLGGQTVLQRALDDASLASDSGPKQRS